jgi:hypothetical protein
VLHARGLLSDERLELLRSWRHSGFSVFARRRIPANDREQLEQLARTLRRSPISPERLSCRQESETVLDRAGRRLHPRHRGNFRIFEPLVFPATALLHVPEARQHQSIAYGVYSNAARGKKRRDGFKGADVEAEPAPVRDARLRSRWREIMRRVFEVDPLRCRRCGGFMVPIAVIIDPVVVERILRHLGLWRERSPPEAAVDGTRPAAPASPERVLQHDPECDGFPEDDGNQVPEGWD